MNELAFNQTVQDLLGAKAVDSGGIQEKHRSTIHRASASFRQVLLNDPPVLSTVQFFLKASQIKAEPGGIREQGTFVGLFRISDNQIVHFLKLALGIRGQRCFMKVNGLRVRLQRAIPEDQSDLAWVCIHEFAQLKCCLHR